MSPVFSPSRWMRTAPLPGQTPAVSPPSMPTAPRPGQNRSGSAENDRLLGRLPLYPLPDQHRVAHHFSGHRPQSEQLPQYAPGERRRGGGRPAGSIFLLLLFSRRIVRPVAESYEKQKRFITDAGHEIKTPLTIIGADTDLLELDLGENEWLDDIKRQTKRLTGLTQDLIYLARMDEEQPQLQPINFRSPTWPRNWGNPSRISPLPRASNFSQRSSPCCP